MTMMPTLVSNSSTMVVRICPRLLEMFINTSVMLPARIDMDSIPAVRLVANWKTNAAPRHRGVRASDCVNISLISREKDSLSKTPVPAANSHRRDVGGKAKWARQTQPVDRGSASVCLPADEGAVPHLRGRRHSRRTEPAGDHPDRQHHLLHGQGHEHQDLLG